MRNGNGQGGYLFDELFNTDIFRPLNKDFRFKHGFPNSFYVAETMRREKVGVLVSWRSKRGIHFPLNVSGLQKMCESDKIKQGYVALANGEQEAPQAVVSVLTSNQVHELLIGKLTREGQYGPYWFVDDDFKMIPERPSHNRPQESTKEF